MRDADTTPLFLSPQPFVIPAKAGIHTCPSGFLGYPPEYAPTVIPAQAGIQNSGRRPAPPSVHTIIPAPLLRHSRESGNPHPAFPQFGVNRGSGFRPAPE